MSQLISPEDLPRWVPGDILRASDGQGWKDVALRTYRYDGLDVQVPSLADFMIVSYKRGNTRMERRFEGRWTRTECHAGDLSLLTRSQVSHWHWTENIDVDHVYLSEALVSRLAADVLGRSVAEVRLHDLLKARDPVVSGIVDALSNEAGASCMGGAVYAEALGSQLVVHLLRRYASVNFVDRSGSGELPPTLRRRVADYIEARLEHPLSLQELASVVCMGEWTFGRRFRASFGTTAHQYILDRRIDRARRLLTQGALPPKAVAAACGFADQAHMTRVMRARLGCTPAGVRQSSKR